MFEAKLFHTGTPGINFGSAARKIPLGNVAATKKVAVRQWPETPADEAKCATPATTFIQYNFIESNGAKKPPQAASTCGDFDATFVYFRDPQLFGLGATDLGAMIAYFGHPQLLGQGAGGVL